MYSSHLEAQVAIVYEARTNVCISTPIKNGCYVTACDVKAPIYRRLLLFWQVGLRPTQQELAMIYLATGRKLPIKDCSR